MLKNLSPIKKIALVFIVILGVALFSLNGCKKEPVKEVREDPYLNITRPAFSADTAYTFVQNQVDFGYRVPGTPEHKETANWLTAKLAEYVDNVIVQTAPAKMPTGEDITMHNIIGTINPDVEERILLAAHWDTRYKAEKDPDVTKQNLPIEGANDGASGVGVLLEIARQLKATGTQKGIDIILFDAEDQGDSGAADSYCLGSQYWSKNPHKPGYKAKYGILLDMVGAADASFKYENFSYENAKNTLEKTWNIGQALGYGYLFKKGLGGFVTDDHYYVMKNRGIPMIDIIDNDASRGKQFGEYHHTHADNMEGIDKNTLQAVGEVVLAVIEFKELR